MTDILYREIGRRIRRARENLGISQEDLACRLDYSSPATISHFEAGERRISVVDLQRIAAILGIPTAYFLEEPQSAEVRHFRFRASEVRPNARTSVAAFLAFAQKHGSSSPEIAPDIASLRPGAAADRVLSDAGVSEPPVMPRLIAAHLRIQVFDWEFPEEVSGIFVSEGGGACIGVNQSHPHVRQRFTIAHELGHCIYADGRDLFVDFGEAEAAARKEDSQQQVLETRANQFAADLLMPRAWVRADVRARSLDTTMLAKRYEVSEQALWFRLLALGLDQGLEDGSA